MQNAAGNNSPQLDLINLGVGGQRTYQYDAAGNQTQVDAAGNVVNRTYDDAGRMSFQERPAANTSTSFVYDGRSFLREAVGRFPEDSAVSIFCDGFESGDLFAWTTGTSSPCLLNENIEAIYGSQGQLYGRDDDPVLYFSGQRIAQHATGNSLSLTSDHLSTPILATDSSGQQNWIGGFEPFGSEFSDAEGAGDSADRGIGYDLTVSAEEALEMVGLIWFAASARRFRSSLLTDGETASVESPYGSTSE